MQMPEGNNWTEKEMKNMSNESKILENTALGLPVNDVTDMMILFYSYKSSKLHSYVQFCPKIV